MYGTPMMRMPCLVIATSTFFLLSIATSLGQSMLIDDFRSNPEQRWQFFADTVMGGVSTGQMEFTTKDGTSFARLTGAVSTENNGGFIQIRREIETIPSTTIKGVRLIVRGNKQRYFVHVRTSWTVLPWQYYQAPYDVSPEWQEVRIPLSSFERSGKLLVKVPAATSIKSIAIVAFGRDHAADIEVREIGFY
jgi:hypothetical protein